MRLLVDECVHAAIVGWLRARGHDVVYAGEGVPGESDHALLLRAARQQRVVVTADKDFGDLVAHGRQASAGVLLPRQRDSSVAARIHRLEALWLDTEPRLGAHLIVVSDRSVRVRPLGRVPDPRRAGDDADHCGEPSVRYDPASLYCFSHS